jgi:SAM-dependent methyltransferase
MDWWNEFFAKAWPRMQAGGYPPERTSAECDRIVQILSPAPGARILDIPCGIGRHSVELSRRGYRLTGVDVQPEFVAAARAEADSAALSPEFLVGDMREYQAAEPFDAAFCYFGSFGYFSEADDRLFLRRVADALRPGGAFLLEGHIQETLLPIYQPRGWNRAGPEHASVIVVEERSWNLETGRIDVTWRLVEGETVTEHSSSMRIYAYREIKDLLLSSGFSRAEARDAKTGEPFRMGAGRVSWLAVRS